MTKRKERSGFALYHEDLETAMEVLDSRELGMLLGMLNAVSLGAEVPVEGCSRQLLCMYRIMSKKIIRDAEKYKETCERNREFAKKRYADAQERMPTHAVAERALPRLPTGTETGTENETETGTGEGEETETESHPAGKCRTTKASAFVPPTPQMAEDYSASLGHPGEGQNFHDYYAARGWKTSSTPMQDWQAALRRWVRQSTRDAPENSTSGHGGQPVARGKRQVSAQHYTQRHYTEEQMDNGATLALLLEAAQEEKEALPFSPPSSMK